MKRPKVCTTAGFIYCVTASVSTLMSPLLEKRQFLPATSCGETSESSSFENMQKEDLFHSPVKYVKKHIECLRSMQTERNIFLGI